MKRIHILILIAAAGLLAIAAAHTETARELEWRAHERLLGCETYCRVMTAVGWHYAGRN